jgi:Carboxypeptidase regulatory-like domain
MKKLLFITFFALVCPALLLAQSPNSNEQNAKMAKPGEPIPGVGINLAKLEGGKETLASQVVTDANGDFEFKNLAPGKYVISVGRKHLGNVKYEDMTFTVVSPRDAASGMASGKRQHSPIRIVKEFGIQEPGSNVAIPSNSSKSAVENKDREDIVITLDTEAGAQAGRAAGTDFNSSRSNRERGTIARDGSSNGTSGTNNSEAGRAAGTDFNSSRSNRERGTIARDGSSNGTATTEVLNKIDSLAIVQGIEITENVTIVGNVLKTKHDTAKNSIGNIR